MQKCVEIGNLSPIDEKAFNEKIQIKKYLGDLLLLFISKSEKALVALHNDVNVILYILILFQKLL